jgi:hypothetical protein
VKRKLRRTATIFAAGIVLTVTLLLGGCRQPVETPASGADPSDTVKERIQRVENGLIAVSPEGGQGAVIMTNSAGCEGAIRFEILLSIAAEYGWPLTFLPFETIDLVVVVAANLFNLLMTAIFLTRPKGWKRFERIAGLVMVSMALPLGAAVILNLQFQRAWWFIVLPLPLILHCIVELLLDYILKLDFRRGRLLGPYLALFYLGQLGMIGYAFVVEPVYGFVTLATYFLCLGATRYAHLKGVG